MISAALWGEDAAPSEQHDPAGPWCIQVHFFNFSTEKKISSYSLNTKWSLITINNCMFKPKIPILKSFRITGSF